MKIRILRGTNASGKSLEAGKIYDVSDEDAKILIALKKAIEVTDEEEKKDKKK